MYKLKLYIDTDGDFGYSTSLYNDYDSEHKFYYSSREEAVEDLKTLFSDMTDTMYTSRDYLQYIVETIKKFNPIVNKIVKKIDTFSISFYFGNPEMYITLSKTEKIDTDKGYYYEDKEIDFDFDGAQNLDYYNWDKLDDLEDLE